MRSEITALIAELREPNFGAAEFWAGYKHRILDLAADRLQSILDADPVSKLEAMGYTVVLTGEGATVELCAASNNEELLFRESMGRYVAPAAIAQAATRLLARIEGE